MDTVIAALWGALAQIMPSFVGRVLLALGIGIVTYTGVDTLLVFAIDSAKNAISGLSGDVVSMLAYMWIDKAISMVFSAANASLLLKGASAGVLKRFVPGA